MKSVYCAVRTGALNKAVCPLWRLQHNCFFTAQSGYICQL